MPRAVLKIPAEKPAAGNDRNEIERRDVFMYGMYGYGYGYGLDPTIILVLIGVALSLWAQGRVNSTFSRYSRVRSMTGMTGAEAARRL